MTSDGRDIAHSGAFSTRPAQFEIPERADAEELRGHGAAGYARLAQAGAVTGAGVVEALKEAGLEAGDPRLSATFDAFGARAEDSFDEDAFCATLPAEEARLVRRALTGGLASEDFPAFRRRIANIFYYSAEETAGEIADYIPVLAQADPEAYAMGLCTIDGQRFETGLREGDSKRRFCVQSAMKPINYALAQELIGAEMVHRHVGREPSGQSFNEITLDGRRRPHNPMINAGAIITSALIKPGASVEQRLDFIRRVWRSASAGEACGFDRTTYESELEHADRNYALAYFMRENGCFPEEADLHEALDLYFRCCAIEVDVRRLSAVAATFANGGVCPVTERQVFQRETVKNTLSLMLSCGMYDFSGEYAFTVGLPAKSGVSGALMIVVPGVAGFALYSPRLGPKGNPQRGVEFSRRLVEAFPWHVYAPIVVDPEIG